MPVEKVGGGGLHFFAYMQGPPRDLPCSLITKHTVQKQDENAHRSFEGGSSQFPS